MKGPVMQEQQSQNVSGEFLSPGGFVFGVQGWNWGEQRPTSITFFIDGTARVHDQHGRPIKGIVREGKPIYFAKCNHAQTIDLLTEERIDWRTLSCAGWPQLPYERLKTLYVFDEKTKIPVLPLPPTPLDELKKIVNSEARKDALKLRREVDTARQQELKSVEDE